MGKVVTIRKSHYIIPCTCGCKGKLVIDKLPLNEGAWGVRMQDNEGTWSSVCLPARIVGALLEEALKDTPAP